MNNEIAFTIQIVFGFLVLLTVCIVVIEVLDMKIERDNLRKENEELKNELSVVRQSLRRLYKIKRK